MNINLLRSEMALFGDKDKDLADCLGIGSSAVSAKMCGKVDFSRTDVNKIIKRYNLSQEKVMAIFFN